MPQYKHLTPELVAQVAADVDRELEEANRLDNVRAWAKDPRNAAQLAHIQAEFARIDAAQGAKLAPRPTASQRTPQPAPVQRTASSGLPSGYKSRAQLEAERPWLAPRKPELESVICPYAGRKANRI
jgi:hypothetical protein